MMANQPISNPKIQREHNQKDATATTQTTNNIRDIPLFRRNRHNGNLHAGLSSDSNDPFSTEMRNGEFGILTSDDGFNEFSVWERKMGLWTEKSGGCSLTI
ncbi:MAG: hypothetical protein WBR24_06345 [Desulfobacterales bacterium]